MMSRSLPIDPSTISDFGSIPAAAGGPLHRAEKASSHSAPASCSTTTAVVADGGAAPSGEELLAAAFDLITRILMAPDAGTARQFSGHLICEYLQADFVVIGKQAAGSMPCQAAVVSGSCQPSPHRRDDIDAALSETVVTGREHRIVPDITSQSDNEGRIDSQEASLASLAHRQLFEALGGQRGMLSIPLVDTSDQVVGAILVVWPAESSEAAARHASWGARFLQQFAAPLADCFAVLDRTQPNRLQLWLTKAQQQLGDHRGRWLIFAMAVVCLIGLYPIRYPVRADVTMQAKTRRFIASPINAPLLQIHVHPGERVRKGDLLLTLDAKQTQSQLQVLQADADRAMSERSGYLAAGSLGEAELARLKAVRLQGEIEQLQQHLRRTEIRSPIDGVVLGDDLEPLQGASLETGDHLFEIAPLDCLMADLEIAPDQILHVASGQPATIKLEAAGRLGEQPIDHIQPRAEANASGQYCFHAKVEIANESNRLKPGMRGVATIKTDRHPLAWCLFQRLWQRIRTWS